MKVVSGGQTGVDQAALDAALELKIDHGGWCPKNRRWEKDGCIPEHYKLEEMPTFNYKDRTKQNLIDSDGTLLINEGRLDGGTLLTKNMSIELGKPLWQLQLDDIDADAAIEQFIMFMNIGEPKIKTLNVAGPRESKRPGIHHRTFNFLVRAFEAWKETE